MAVQHPLGPARRSGGVHQQGFVVGGERRLAGRRRTGKFAGVDDRHPGCLCLAEVRCRIAIDDGEACAAVAQRMAMGTGAGGEVQRRGAKAAKEQSEQHEDGRPPVVKERDDTLAPGGAGSRQGPGDRLRSLEEAAPREIR